MEKQSLIVYVNVVPEILLDWNGDGRPLESKLKVAPAIYQRPAPGRVAVNLTVTLEVIEKKGPKK